MTPAQFEDLVLGYGLGLVAFALWIGLYVYAEWIVSRKHRQEQREQILARIRRAQ